MSNATVFPGRRAIVDAIFYAVRHGCTWHAWPADLPHWNTVFWYFSEWQRDGAWDKIEDALRRAVRRAMGREAEPSAGVADSQTVRATEQPGPRGYDGGKKITGIKRHVCVDTIGLVWGLVITTADVADCKGARLAVTDAMCVSRRRVTIGADAAYQGFIAFALRLLALVVSIGKGRKGAPRVSRFSIAVG